MASGSIAQLSDEEFVNVEKFMSTKRLAIIHALLINGSMTQSQLASTINSTVTSLSNIIRLFDVSGLGLLSVEREGRYRRYSLSQRGLAFARRKWSGELADDTAVNGAGRLYADASDALRRFKELFQGREPAYWELKFDEAVFKREGGELWLDGEAEDVLNDFLNSLEMAILTDDLESHEQIMKLLDEPFLRSRIESFMDIFQPFVPFLRAVNNGSEEFDVSCVIKAALTGQPDDETVKCRERAGIKADEFDSMAKAASCLAKKIAGHEKGDIYRYFSGLLPNQKWLCSMIAQIL